jgi:shikimate kinase
VTSPDGSHTSAEGPRVVLVGAPGSGKTTVGRLLAKRWQVEFRDTDHDIEQNTGRTVSDIFIQQGEEHFRSLERLAVASALQQHRGVLALGAGAVLDDDTRRLLRNHLVVHLDVGLAAAMKRLEMNRSRPLLVGNVRGRWQELAAERRPLYTEVATVTVSTDGPPAQQVAAAVEAALQACEEESTQ